jgi:hypothetical protein
MPAPTISLPTTGTDPKVATKAGLEGAINPALETLYDDIQTRATASSVALKAPINSPTFTGTVAGITKTMVGLGNVDNTSDVNKPVSTAQQAALDAITEDLKNGLASGGGESAGRPGDFPDAFAGALTGTWDDITAAAGSVVTDTDMGSCLEIVGSGIVAGRRATPILPGRIYQARWVCKRTVDTADPLGDAIVFGVQYLDGSQAATSAYISALNLFISQGVYISSPVTFSLEGVGVDVTLPAGTKYVRHYLRTYGTSPTTRVGWVVFEDITEAAVSDDIAAAVAAAATATTKAAEADASADAADVSEAAAAASAAAALVSQTVALAAANAAGPTVIYATKALADAGLAGLAANTVVEVSVDESRASRRSRYRKTGGVYVFELNLTGPQTVYLDVTSGSDANSGLTALLPKLTLSAAVALLSAGDTLLIKRGTRMFTPFSSTLTDLTIGAYGHGPRPIIDGSMACTGTWTLDGTYTNTWYLDITLPEATGGDYASNSSSAFHPSLWDEAANNWDNRSMAVWRVLRNDVVAGVAVGAAATQAQILTIVDANPGHFTIFKQGSSNAEPRNASESGTLFRVYMRTRDGTNPNTNGRTVRIARFIQVATFGNRAKVEDLVMQRISNKDLVGVHGPGDRPEYFRRCDFLGAAIHGSVLGGVETRDCVAEASWSHNDSIAQGGGAFNYFYGGENLPGLDMFNCRAVRFQKAAYAHGSGSPSYNLRHFNIDGLVSDGCTVVFEPGDTLETKVLRNIRAYGVTTIATIDTVPTVIEDSEFYGVGTPSQTLFVNYGLSAIVTMRNSFAYNFEGLIIEPFAAPAHGSAADYSTLTLVDSTVDGTFTNPGNVKRTQFNLVLQNSILRTISDGGLNDLWVQGSITADATSNVEFGLTARELLTATHVGAVAGVLTGARRQTLAKTILTGDITYFNSGRDATYSGVDNGDGTANLTINFNNANYGRSVRVIDAYGAGLHYDGRLVNKGVAGSSQIIVVAPPPSGAFTSKALHAGVFNKFLFRDAITATISPDGTQIRVPDGALFNVGSFFNVGHPNGGTPYGVRQVTVKSGNVLTLDRACVWTTPPTGSALIAFNSIDGTTTTDRNALPTVSLTFGFPMRALSAGMDNPKAVITRVEGGDLTYRQQGGGLAKLGPSLDPPDVNAAGAALSFWSGVNNFFGYLEQGIGVYAGDVLTFTADVSVDQDRLSYVTDPLIARAYVPTPTCEPIRRRAGYRPKVA